MRGLKAMLWEASVLDPVEARSTYPAITPSLTSRTGHPLPRALHSGLSESTPCRTRRQGDHPREHALAPPDRTGPVRRADARALAGARGEGRPAQVRRGPRRLASTPSYPPHTPLMPLM